MDTNNSAHVLKELRNNKRKPRAKGKFGGYIPKIKDRNISINLKEFCKNVAENFETSVLEFLKNY